MMGGCHERIGIHAYTVPVLILVCEGGYLLPHFSTNYFEQLFVRHALQTETVYSDGLRTLNDQTIFYGTPVYRQLLSFQLCVCLCVIKKRVGSFLSASVAFIFVNLFI
eukprot:GHVO01065881.1.p1 GENE.GHVO01065881.1~~GHVO01065881.1.p1  ORF type:complete len:108 (-),score=13.50 GHVO01065881.1:202-525(-)